MRQRKAEAKGRKEESGKESRRREEEFWERKEVSKTGGWEEKNLEMRREGKYCGSGETGAEWKKEYGKESDEDEKWKLRVVLNTAE